MSIRLSFMHLTHNIEININFIGIMLHADNHSEELGLKRLYVFLVA